MDSTDELDSCWNPQGALDNSIQNRASQIRWNNYNQVLYSLQDADWDWDYYIWLKEMGLEETLRIVNS